MLQFAEEALDEIALTIESRVDGSLDPTVTLGGYVSFTAPPVDQIDEMLPIVSAVGDDDGGFGQPFQQVRCRRLVRGVPRCESQAQRQSALVDNDVDLAAQSSTRTTDGVIRAPFLPPAACWWARTTELSMSCSDCGDAAASASKTPNHTPALAHRL